MDDDELRAIEERHNARPDNYEASDDISLLLTEVKRLRADMKASRLWAISPSRPIALHIAGCDRNPCVCM